MDPRAAQERPQLPQGSLWHPVGKGFGPFWAPFWFPFELPKAMVFGFSFLYRLGSFLVPFWGPKTDRKSRKKRSEEWKKKRGGEIRKKAREAVERRSAESDREDLGEFWNEKNGKILERILDRAKSCRSCRWSPTRRPEGAADRFAHTAGPGKRAEDHVQKVQ